MVYPGLHELTTICGSVGKLVVGDVGGAGKVWTDYSEESVIGSGLRAAVHGIAGDTEEATRIAKGMGRAYGRACTGGGLFSEIPVFKELDKCGKSLGDVIGGGDMESARKRWTEEWCEEYQSGSNWAKAGVQVATVLGGIGVTVLTAGLATGPYYAAMVGAGAGISAASNATNQGIDIAAGNRKSFDVGSVVGSSLEGGAMGAIATKISRARAKGKLSTHQLAQEAELGGTGHSMVDPVSTSKNSALNDFMTREAKHHVPARPYPDSNCATSGLPNTVSRQAPPVLVILDAVETGANEAEDEDEDDN